MPVTDATRFDEAFAWLSSFTDWEQKLHLVPARGTFELGRMRRLLARLGHPESGPRIAHITGTKGKTSVTWMTEIILRAHGVKTLRYLSPHLRRIEERIAIDGLDITRDELAALIFELRDAVLAAAAEDAKDLPSFFEAMTLIAFLAARRHRVEAIALEVGVGGRLDATNVVDPTIAVVTSIGLEHQRLLGDTLQKIAYEKAGIFKSGRPAIHGLDPCDPARPTLEARAQEVGTPLRGPAELGALLHCALRCDRAEGPRLSVVFGLAAGVIGPLTLVAGSAHQARNALLAINAAQAVLEALGRSLDIALTRAALDGLAVPGRCEWRSGPPPVLLDGAHTVESVTGVAETARAMAPEGMILLVFALLRERSAEALIRPFLKHPLRVITTAVDNPRSQSAADLSAEVARLGVPVEAIDDPHQALATARRSAGPEDLIVVTGSLYLVGELIDTLPSGKCV